MSAGLAMLKMSGSIPGSPRQIWQVIFALITSGIKNEYVVRM